MLPSCSSKASEWGFVDLAPVTSISPWVLEVATIFGNLWLGLEYKMMLGEGGSGGWEGGMGAVSIAKTKIQRLDLLHYQVMSADGHVHDWSTI